MLALMIILSPWGQMKRQETSSTDADTIWKRPWFLGNIVSSNFISSFNLARHAISIWYLQTTYHRLLSRCITDGNSQQRYLRIILLTSIIFNMAFCVDVRMRMLRYSTSACMKINKMDLVSPNDDFCNENRRYWTHIFLLGMYAYHYCAMKVHNFSAKRCQIYWM